jgi:peptide/nickel transport system substrate-binding protein
MCRLRADRVPSGVITDRDRAERLGRAGDEEESGMPSSLRARAGRIAVAAMLALAALVPGAAPAIGADPLILRVGTDQTFSGLNPWQATYVLDYEVFTLNYDLLVGYDQNLGSAPGFAESWTTSPDGLTTTFKIRAGMKWSDGEPATSADAEYTYKLALDAIAKEVTLGSGYIDGYLSSAGLKSISAPDPTTFVVTTETPTALLLPAYVPILPKHIWSKYTLTQIADAEAEGAFLNDAPVVGTGPYTAVEYKSGEFMRFARNPNYWGKQGAADEVILQHFASGDTMVTSLKTGEIDYARGISADAFDALATSTDVKTVEGFANGYSYLTFNGYSKSIAGGGSSTSATRDPAFRDALAYAMDLPTLVDRVLAGHGTPGTSLLPPFQAKWYVAPAADKLRTFNIDTAKTKLEAAGYQLDAAGKRLDKDGKVITLRMTWPASEPELATVAQFVTEWWGQLGIGVEAAVTEDETLLTDLLPPEGKGKANFDTYMWGWVGDVDPDSLLAPFTTDEIKGLSSDTFWSNARFDELYKAQGKEVDETKRKAMLQEMQEIFYAEVPNIPIYFDSELHAYRTDRFGGWQNQPPANGTPLFGFGPIGYTLLTDASIAPSPSPVESAAAPSAGAATPAPSAGPSSPAASTGDNTTLLVVGVIVAIAVVVGLLMAMRRRGRVADEE